MARTTVLCGGLFFVGLLFTIADLIGRASFQGDITIGGAGFWEAVYSYKLVMKYGAMLLIGCAVCAFRMGLVARSKNAPYVAHWMIVAALVVLVAATKYWALYSFALDAIRDTDDRIGLPLTAPAIAVVALAIFSVPYWRFFWDLYPPLRRWLCLSAGLYLSGQVVLEAVSEHLWYAYGSTALSYVAVTALEELSEIGGATIAIGAMMHYGVARSEEAPSPNGGA